LRQRSGGSASHPERPFEAVTRGGSPDEGDSPRTRSTHRWTHMRTAQPMGPSSSGSLVEDNRQGGNRRLDPKAVLDLSDSGHQPDHDLADPLDCLIFWRFRTSIVLASWSQAKGRVRAPTIIDHCPIRIRSARGAAKRLEVPPPSRARRPTSVSQVIG
jgi:hypothetical protein